MFFISMARTLRGRAAPRHLSQPRPLLTRIFTQPGSEVNEEYRERKPRFHKRFWGR